MTIPTTTQATYGIWAGDSDDSGDGDPDARPSFSGGGRGGGGAGKNAPVNFVSAGIQQVRGSLTWVHLASKCDNKFRLLFLDV